MVTGTEYFWINGHRNDCAYVRSLDDDNDEGHEQCDCGKDDDDGDHCLHASRASYEDDWDTDDDFCVHCECCCTCLSCEYGPQDGMPLNYTATASDAS